MKNSFFLFISISFLMLFGCKQSKNSDVTVISSEILTPNTTFEKQNPRTLAKDFNKYWYQGTAEITSYKLTQSRYGELRAGTAVTVFVTEDFIPDKQVKADRQHADNIPVLKLNKTKKFKTGIYPYSIMTSVFNSVQTQEHALKVSNSVQEWCGQTYMQLNNRKKFDIKGHSYFENEGDIELSVQKTWLEDELLNLIRLAPASLPTGEIYLLPAFETIRLTHKELKAYKATASLKKGNTETIYSLDYPGLKRKLDLHFSNAFPHTIEKWEETHANGQVTRAVKMKRIQSAYWRQNSNKYLALRDSLGL